MKGALNEIRERTVPFPESEIIDDIFGGFGSAARKGGVPVVLFCAGSTAKQLMPLLARHGISPAGICDNNPARAGESFLGYPLMSFDDLKRRHRDSLILIASAAYQAAVRKQLLENGFSGEKILCLDADGASGEGLLKRERTLMFARNGDPKGLLEDLQRDEEKVEEALSVLADRKSRELFLQRLALAASGFQYPVYRDFLFRFSEPVLKSG
ncbi:MAG TPA: hypothetical protein VLS90_02955, partial [Thermodesulfobacteriota bacterium]|nr:hypothetical protein [Thermodesulfobacteriota bacterium]